jgi:FlaA1/EpsC-like NDP-sugar epimerase
MMNSPFFERVHPTKPANELDLKQLLGRTEVALDAHPIRKFLKGKRVLITGAAGSVGAELYRQIVDGEPSELTLLDQSAALVRSPFDLPKTSFKLNKFVVNICNKSAVHQVFNQVKPELVFHAAALKHIALVEAMHREAVHVNIIGTEIVATAAMQTEAQKFVFVSSDKAVNPTSFMGATKRFGEMMMHRLTSENTKFITARFGNILGSSGSVIPLFLEQIRRDRQLSITHPDMARYFMTAFEAGQLLLDAGRNGKAGQIFIARMGSPVHITALAERMLLLLGTHAGIRFTGIRPGEKLYEEVFNEKDILLPSHHPDVMVALLNAPDIPDVDKLLSQFKTALRGQKNELLLPLLMSAVPEYRS